MRYLMGFDTLFTILAAVVAFVLTLKIARRGTGKLAGTALVFIVPLPVLVSVLWLLKGMTSSFGAMVAREIPLQPAEVSVALYYTVLPLLISMLLMLPSYVLAMLFLFRRSLQADSMRLAASEA